MFIKYELIPILLFVDILSRKAWAYVLTKSQKEKSSVAKLKEFQSEVGNINGLEGDNKFQAHQLEHFVKIMILD